MSAHDHNGGLILVGLDGSNPLAFLAALGTLRTLDLSLPHQEVKMAWAAHCGAWRPRVKAQSTLTESDCLDALVPQLGTMVDHRAFAFADNLSVDRAEFRAHALGCTEDAHRLDGAGRRIAADFAAAFACDAVCDDDGKVQDTALRTMSGAGHQHFLGFVRNIVAHADREHLRKSLFAAWQYDDPVTNQTLRWDPLDDNRYALQWRDPSGDPTRKAKGAMLGANRLAIEALPLVTSTPSMNRLSTVGFSGRGSRDTYWTWPIWRGWLSVDLCRSLLASPCFVSAEPLKWPELFERGVVAAFRSRRITVGKFRNFGPSEML